MPVKRSYIREPYTYRYWAVSSSVPWTSRPPTVLSNREHNFSSDLLISQSNKHQLLGKTKERIGGDFHTVKREHEGTNRELRLNNSHDWALRPNDARWIGPSWAKHQEIRNTTFPADSSSSWAALDAFGATAIARVKPDTPVFSLAQAIGEAREGMPSIPALGAMRQRAKSLRERAGSEHLNVEFGWKPLINDVETLIDTVHNAEKLWAQYQKNSGKLLKRKYRWPTEDNVVETVTNTGNHPVPKPDATVYRSATGGKLTTRTRTRTERWFEGVFAYPEIPINRDDWYSKAKYLYGIRFTPDVLWELQPWSWLADWFTNTGDLMKNITSFMVDGLVMPWGYVMETKTVEVTYTLEMPAGTWWTSPFTERMTWHQRFKTTVKKRRTATPFGFGFNMSALTNRQIGILVALGLSRT